MLPSLQRRYFHAKKETGLEICALIVDRELDITWAAISRINALEYAPDARAYWGLGLLAQAEGDDRKAGAILREGIQMFQDDTILARVLINTLTRFAGKRRCGSFLSTLMFQTDEI